MPFQRNRLDYIVASIMLISFVWAFFFGSTWGDIHGQTNPDPASASYVNMWVMLGPLIVIYEMLQLYVLPGKRRGRELPWKLYYTIFMEMARNKIQSGIQEYHEFRKHENIKK